MTLDDKSGYQATGSCSGFPETRRNLMPSSPARISISSPQSNSTSERFSTRKGAPLSSAALPKRIEIKTLPKAKGANV